MKNKSIKKKCYLCEKRMREYIGDECDKHKYFYERCVVCHEVKHHSELKEIKGWYMYRCPDCISPINRAYN